MVSDLDGCLRVLSKRERRVILTLLRHRTPYELSDLIAHLSDPDPDAALMLRHSHLPLLEEAGYIEWDREKDQVSQGPRFHEISPLLELFETHSTELPGNWP